MPTRQTRTNPDGPAERIAARVRSIFNNPCKRIERIVPPSAHHPGAAVREVTIMQDQLTELEALAVSEMRKLGDHGTIHDYRNILLPVDRAYRAVNAAYRAISKAHDELRFHKI